MNLQGLFVYTFLITIMECFAINLSKQSPYITLHNGKSKERSFLRWNIIIPFLIFSIIFGMRWNVGWDHIPYLYAYTYDEIERFEFGFKSITRIFQSADIHYVFYFALWAFIQIYFFFISFKKEYYLFPFLTIFIFTQSEVSFWMNGIRQAIAMCIILYSITYIDKKKPLLYVLFSLIAISFHRSAIVITVILYPLLMNGKCLIKNRTIQYIILFFAFIGQSFLYNNSMFLENLLELYNKLIGYTGDGIEYSMEQLSAIEKNNRIGYVYIIRLVEVIIIIAYSSKLRSFYNSRWFNILYNLFFIGTVLSYLAPGNINNIDRLFRYFYIYKPIMLSYLCYFLYKYNQNTKKLSFSLIFLDILGWTGANVRNGWSFDFFFQHDINDIILYLK